MESLVKEADLPPDIGAGSNSSITVESILQEKKIFDLSLNFEKSGIDDGNCQWALPAPTKPKILESLPNRSNILSIAVFDLLLPSTTVVKQYVAVTTADRQLHLLNPTSNFQLVHSYASFQDSPILDMLTLSSRYMVIASMSGKLLLYDTVSDKTLDIRKDHSKYVVKIAHWSDGGSVLIASAGWDSKVFLYRVDLSEASPRIGEPFATLALSSIPETILFITSPESRSPVLLVARRDSTFLYYYSVPDLRNSTIKLLGKQNLAPHSNAWVAFTPADIQICPTDPSMAAVATSSTPHMKLLILKLLLPPTQPAVLDANADADANESVVVTQASQARAELLVANREEAAIMVNVSTMAPQTAYSTPRLTWRPDGTGIYVSSDDGVVRGFEASSGKLVASLGAHEPGSKLRTLWGGHIRVHSSQDVDSTSDHEFLISGGFDQRLILWSC